MNSFLSWIGGKHYLKKIIYEEFPKEIGKYVEVFGGAGWLYFYKKRSKYEIYNDLDKNLINLFRIVKYHPNALTEELDLLLPSRLFFEEFKSTYSSEHLTDVQRAARFFYIAKYSFGSKCENFVGAKAPSLINVKENIKKASERLDKTTIECLDFEKCILKYDKEDTFFYLDPPYYGTEDYYINVEFTKEDHIRLRDILKGIKGKFLLSYNNCEEIKKLYKDFEIKDIVRINNLNNITRREKEYKEILIKNY